MIVAQRKPYDEIRAIIEPFDKVLVFGCGACVTVSSTGGEKETQILASQLSITDAKEGRSREYVVKTVERQCEKEFLAEAEREIAAADAVLSLACGAGVGLIAEVFPSTRALPAMNTTFLAAGDAPGSWAERCSGCGDCVLHLTGGICPVSRCAKSILNGPCGGTHDGKCEIGDDVDCAWTLILDRMKALGLMDKYAENAAAKDRRPGGHGGPRKMTREDLAV